MAPPAPPWIKIVSPGCSFNVSSMALMAVRPVSAKAAATCDSPVGLPGDDGGLDRDLLGVGAFLAGLANAKDRIADL
jgi:hypothetical protein